MARKIHEKVPHAKMLLVALRSVGYTNETAIADIVDNSVSGSATEVELYFDWNNRRIIIADTSVHKALREALANCLINADYYGTRGVVIRKEVNRLIFENPGYIRTGKIQMRKGGESDPRNKSLMKMFNLINIGERSGSGVPNIFNTWEDKGWKEPIIEERFDPDRTVLTLEFVERQAKKIDEENKRRKQVKKTSEENKRRKQAKKTSRENS